MHDLRFLLEEADPWRPDIYRMVRQRPDVHFQVITKRITRFWDCLPPDWGEGYPNLSIGCTIENQRRCEERLPFFLTLPIREKFLVCKPLLEGIGVCIRPHPTTTTWEYPWKGSLPSRIQPVNGC